MNNEVAISVKDISKSFKVPHEKHDTLKSKAIHIFSSRKYSKYNALSDINLEIKKGEFFGIVGKNGCGKSTLLKIIANIYAPTKGEINVKGNIAPFIELGVGFNPELTGRENVFLSGTILGLSRKKIEQLYDEIVDFAELNEFMDQKLKNYSSGMQVRLAFSIAIRSDSDILLIDEVLAVGDSSFQRKCLNYFDKLKKDKRTVVFVSHDMETIKQFCDRAALVDKGKIISNDKPVIIANKYNKLNAPALQNNSKTNKSVQGNITIQVQDEDGKNKSIFSTGEKAALVFKWKKNPSVKNLGVAIMNNRGDFIYGTNTLNLNNSGIEKVQQFFVSIKLDLKPGSYYLTFGTFGNNQMEVIDLIEHGPDITIEEDEHSRFNWEGNVFLPTKWGE